MGEVNENEEYEEEENYLHGSHHYHYHHYHHHHHYHYHHYYNHPPPSNYAPPPPSVVDGPHHQHKPDHMPHFRSSVTHHTHHKDDNELDRNPTVRMYSKAKPSYSLTIRDGTVILARSDPSDTFQHWIKDEKFSARVKDEEGFPSFALINKATGQAMKHSIGATHPVQLIPYNPINGFDESVLWTESKDLGDGYRAIRMVNNIRLNVDAFRGDKTMEVLMMAPRLFSGNGTQVTINAGRSSHTDVWISGCGW